MEETQAAQMDDSEPTRQDAMRCNLQSCPGEYENRKITHTV